MFLQAATALTATLPAQQWSRALAEQSLREADLLAFESLGNVTLLHMSDIHAQLLPVHYREASLNIGVGEARGRPPHLTAKDFLAHFGLEPGSFAASALTSEDFAALARSYGRIGGLDRAARAIKAIRAERGNKVTLLDGGDTWQGSWSALQTRGQDMVDCMALLQPDAMTGHWEFTYGAERVKHLADSQSFPFLGLNIRDTEWNDPVFAPRAMLERGGITIAVLGQAFPYTPVANPRWLIPSWSFGLHEAEIQKQIDRARADGAALVVLLSHNGFDVDRKLAGRVRGLDVILTGHTHDALPVPVQIGRTLLVASGASGKFLSRLDLDVRGNEIRGFRYKLIPLFADAIAPDPEMAAKITAVRAPFAGKLGEVYGQTDTLLYRRGNFNGTFDDLICDALLAERDAEIALSPGFRWGTSILPKSNISFEDITNATAITYPECYRMPMSGSNLKSLLEDVADNLFNPDPYYQQGGDMVRAGGLAYSIDISKPAGQRISDLQLKASGKAIEAQGTYVVAGWASVSEGVTGPAIWDVVVKHVARKQVIQLEPNRAVRVTGY